MTGGAGEFVEAGQLGAGGPSTSSADPPYGDPLTAPFWRAAEQHIFLLQQCTACRRFQFPPAGVCRRCSATGLAMVASAGRGEIYSLTTVHTTVSPNPTTPYSVGIVRLDEGAQLITRLTSVDLHIGQRVRLRWSTRESLPPLPTFEADVSTVDERACHLPSTEHSSTWGGK